MKIKISPIIKIEQNGKIFYIGKLKLSELIKCATVFTRNKSYDIEKYNAFKSINEIIENKDLSKEEADFGTQRRTNEDRLKEIGDYIQNKNGFFPNGLIVSIDPIKKDDSKQKEDSFENIKFDDVISVSDDSIEFDNANARIKIIDGQHRFYGFNYLSENKIKEESYQNFEFILSIFINLPYSEQADLFATINSTQKQVNKSILTDLKSLSIEKYRKLHVSNAIAKWFNEREDKTKRLGLWKGRINMLGIGEGIISQGMFVEAISRLISNDKETRGGIFLSLYSNKEYDKIYIILKKYFSAYEISFKSEWGNKNYLLCKTVGFIAIMKVFEYLYVDYSETKSGSFEEFLLMKLNLFKKSKLYNPNFFTRKNFGSSLSEANKMSNHLLTKMYSTDNIARLRKLIKEQKTKL